MSNSITARFNYTDRQRIELSVASVTLEQEDDHIVAAVTIRDPEHFDSYQRSAHLVVNLARRTLIERLDFGPISGLVQPLRRSSELFSEPAGVQATIKVVSTEPATRGLLLGASSAMSANGAEANDDSPLVLFQRCDLGAVLWRLELDDPTPTVLINSAIEDWEGEVRDIRFQALVFPEITRQIAVWLAGEDDGDDPAQRNWRRFLANLGEPMPSLDADEPKAIHDWANRCSDALARRQNYTIRYIGTADEE